MMKLMNSDTHSYTVSFASFEIFAFVVKAFFMMWLTKLSELLSKSAIDKQIIKEAMRKMKRITKSVKENIGVHHGGVCEINWNRFDSFHMKFKSDLKIEINELCNSVWKSKMVYWEGLICWLATGDDGFGRKRKGEME